MTDEEMHVITKVTIVPWEPGMTGVAYEYDSGLRVTRQMPLEDAQKELARVGERVPINTDFSALRGPLD